MGGDGLEVPQLINSLVATGRWPATAQDELRQNLRQLVAPEQITKVVADEEYLYLYAPPFSSVADDYAAHQMQDWNFWTEYGAIHEIDPNKALLIGDFGPGSDAPILLDYRTGPEPSVIKLAWHSHPDGSGSYTPTTTWVKIADSIQEFAELLGLN